jgi:photosystem II stability/assembly factor-like uncharacterized protein
MRTLLHSALGTMLFVGTLPSLALGQDSKPEGPFAGMSYRCIGPFRGGRSATVVGVATDPNLYYFGATGGGVWRTTDGGLTWQNISDGFFGGSIGAVEVCPSEPRVLYVGGGEKTVRGNVSSGTGMYKSTDAGKSWKFIGLGDARHICRIRVHPRHPEVVYVAALGHLYGPNAERGVFRSRDGGATWQKVLFVNDEVGAVDLLLDPKDPETVYATTWRVKRTPYSLESGGPGSGLWKSTDGGTTWNELTRRPGLPKGTVGIIGVAVSPVDSNRVWAIIEAEDGGVFRSEDAGQTWNRVSEDRNLRQRAWYYTRIYAGPKSRDEVYVVNVELHHSTDGGRTYRTIPTPHGDHHDLWIDPNDPLRMIVADDGGAQVTYNGGRTWSTYMNQPTAQFYRVTTDNHFPYRIYGAQQDNSTVRILSRGRGFRITERDWESTAGGESGWLAPDPRDADVVYGGSYGGYLERVNHRTGEQRNISIWPENHIGHGAAELKYRFQWNFPIFFSPHDPKTLYAAGNVLFKTTNQGQSWTAISPDLTRNDKSKQGPSGGPITKDNTSVEYYCTIFYALESPHERGVLWAGSDDGLVHLSRDGGKTWANVTPPDLPDWSQINCLEAHPFEKGGLYLAATRYKSDDFKPYLYKTTNYGKTWTKIVQGIAAEHFTRAIRADPARKGLLYAGTENGMYISLDDGASWQSFQLNLPVVPITDLALKDNDLIVATQGRSFWVLDDLTPLHQLRMEGKADPFTLLKPRPAYRASGFGGAVPASLTEGQNPPAGSVIWFHLAEVPAAEVPVSLEIRDANEELIRRVTRQAADAGAATPPAAATGRRRRGGGTNAGLELKPGLNRFVWDHRYPDAEDFPGMVLWAAGLQGPKAVPGTYLARLSVGDRSQTVTFEVKADPRASANLDDYRAQFKFLMEVRDKVTETHRAIREIRAVREQLASLGERLKGQPYPSVVAAQTALDKKLAAIEETLYQTKLRSSQDTLNYPIRLNNKLAALAGVVGAGDFRPTDQAIQSKNEIMAAIDQELAKLKSIMVTDVPAFNELVATQHVPAILLPNSSKPTPGRTPATSNP